MDGVEDINQAIYQAAVEARSVYEDKEEAISLIYEKEGKYYFTPPYSTHAKEDRGRAKVTIPKGSLRYIVHNHPSGKGADKFSGEDIDIADKLGVPSAIIFGKNPVIRTYIPGETKTSRHYSGGKQSAGDEFDMSPYSELADQRRILTARKQAKARGK